MFFFHGVSSHFMAIESIEESIDYPGIQDRRLTQVELRPAITPNGLLG